MERVSIDDVEPSSFENGVDRRSLSDPLGTTDVAINHYRIAPGEGFPSGLHAHMDQEEVFVVIEGEATYETMDGEVVVRAGETIRFSPGEFQSGKNESDSELVVFAMGAPLDTEDIRIPVECPECGQDDMRLVVHEDGSAFVCPDCSAERIPQGCPECGRDEMRVVLNEETKPIVACPECGVEREKPSFET
jgi:uncharacterized cupin superfamily protein